MRPHTHPSRHPIAAVLIVSLTGCLAAGCSLFAGKESPSAEVVETGETGETGANVENVERIDTQIFVGDTIEMNYDPNVIMKRAESFHEQEGYAEAIVEYQHFLDMHRSHVLAPYAQYRLSLSHFKMVSTIDRDNTPVKLAREAFVELMTAFPGSQYEVEALATIRKCDRHLAQHHVLVGKFYYRKEAYMAAAKRFRKVVDIYPDLEEAAESKLYLTKTYKALGALEWSRDWALALVQQHPQHALRNEGLQLLAALHKEKPDLADTDPMNQNALITSLVPTNPTLFSSQPSHAATIPASSLASGFRFAAAATQCRVGSWCDAMETFPNNIPTPQSPATRSVTCRPGTWCE